MVAVLAAGATTGALVASRPTRAAHAAGRAAGSAPTTSPVPASTSTIAPTTTTAPGTAALAARLDGVVAGSNACVVVTDGPTPLYSHGAGTALAPASTQKLLVAAAALALLGPDTRFTTTVVAPAAPVAGRVDGLWLVGGGDPMLASPEFIAYAATQPRVAAMSWTSLGSLADALAAAGVRSVVGGVHADDSFLDQLRFLPAWPAHYHSDQEIGPLSALSINEGLQEWKPTTKLVTDPTAFAASELARLLTARHVAAAPAAVPTPPAAAPPSPAGAVTLAQVTSPPVSQIVQFMLSASDNLIAELLVRQIDKHAGGTGTTPGGVAAVLSEATQLGVPTPGAVMLDGSGLAPGDRATCPELLAALQVGTRAGFEAITAGLPVAGHSGTLAGRYVTSPLAGKLRAKTGSIANVGGMVGTLDITRPLSFAYLVNDTMNETQLFAKEDQLVQALATYPETTP